MKYSEMGLCIDGESAFLYNGSGFLGKPYNIKKLLIEKYEEGEKPTKNDTENEQIRFKLGELIEKTNKTVDELRKNIEENETISKMSKIDMENKYKDLSVRICKLERLHKNHL